MLPCTFCAVTWVDQACARAGIRLPAPARRRLIATLLARQHLIISGPTDAGKRRLARALALAMTRDRPSQVLTVQGHPWWAAETEDIARFIELQTRYSLWRLAGFVERLLHSARPSPSAEGRPSRVHVICIERMSPVEIEIYFHKFLQWLTRTEQELGVPIPLRLIGTFDHVTRPKLDERLLHVVGLVHLEGMGQRDRSRLSA